MSGLLTHPTSIPTPKLESAERWTVERKFRSIGTSPSNVPFTILLLDRQYYVSAGACFVRHVRQVHHREAAAKLSQINIPFVAERESLTLHWIRIWRAGEAITLLDRAEDLEIKSADDPDRQIAHFTIKDLRPIDSIDVAYTTRAHQPSRNFSAVHPIRQRVPVLDWHLSAIVPPDRQLNSRCEITELSPTVRKLSEGSNFHQWHDSDVPAPERLSGPAPVWHSSSPELQLSTFPSWLDVALDVNRHWKLKAAQEEVVATAKTFSDRAGQDQFEAARLACRFVQTEITTIPDQPVTGSAVDPLPAVLEESKGDAKAKSVLLVALLRALGIAAAPILVSRARARTLRNVLPAPDVFDHVIVRARIDEADIWIDPCASHQEGPVNEPALPAYAFGLQISTRTKNLCAIPKPSAAANQLSITEHFTVRDDRSSSLTVTLKASGTEANRLRSQLADTTTVEFSRVSLDELRRRFPGAELSAASKAEDDTGANEIVITEKFQLPAIVRGKDNEAHFSPNSIRKNLPQIPERDRSHPIALNFPCNIRHLTVIDTPWTVEPHESSERLPGTGFAFSFKGKAQGKRHTLRYAFNTLDDHLIPVDFDSARLRIDTMRPQLDYRFELPSADLAAPRSKSAKGTRIIKPESSDSSVSKRKSGPNSGPGLLIPILGAIAALVLVLLVKSSFQKKAQAKSEPIRASQIAEQKADEAKAEARAKAQAEAEAAAKPAIPDDPLTFLPPPPPLPGPDNFDDLDLSVGDLSKDTKTADEKKNEGVGNLEFGISKDGPAEKNKASGKEHATSRDWKLSN